MAIEWRIHLLRCAQSISVAIDPNRDAWANACRLGSRGIALDGWSDC
jgi:hypothetical protein